MANTGPLILSKGMPKVEDIEGGVRMTFASQMEIEGQSRPALIASMAFWKCGSAPRISFAWSSVAALP